MPIQIDTLVVEMAQRERERFYGKYRGIVADIDDPEGLARLRATVPAVLGDKLSPWALPCAPYAGPDVGFHAVPPVGAAVWIEFEAGDPNLPIWTGGWWARGDIPSDEAGTVAGTPQKLLKSDSGLMLSLDDDAHTATLSDADGSNLLKISVDAGEIRVQCTTKVIVEAPQIELVEGAPHPLVFGDDLLIYLNQMVALFNAHMHPGQTVIGIPVTPMTPLPVFQPAQPSMLSLKVKTG
jgi:Type VI secretion system/phage-baseplate injector OB domain